MGDYFTLTPRPVPRRQSVSGSISSLTATAGREPKIPAHMLTMGLMGIQILHHKGRNITQQERDVLAPIIRKELAMANKDKGGKKRKKDKAVKPKAKPKAK